MPSRHSGFLLVLFSAACFGFLPVTLRSIYASSDFQPIDVAVWRYLLAVPIVLSVIAWQRTVRGEKSKAKHPPVPVKHLLFLGVCYAAPVLLAFLGLERLPVAVFMLLFYTYPALVAIFSLFIGSRLSGAGWLALAFTLIGAALTIGDFSPASGLDMIGIGIVIIDAASVAIYFMLTGYLLRDSKDNTRNTGWILIGTLLTLLLLIPFFGLKMPVQITTWMGLLVLAGMCTGLPILAMNAGIQRIGAAQASIVGSVELVFSTTLAFLILDEPVLPLQIIGTFFIIGAVILLQARPGASSDDPQPATGTPGISG